MEREVNAHRFFRIFAVVLGGAIFAVPAYSQAAVNSESARPPSPLTIRGKQNSFKIGDEIRIEVTWKNTSAKPVLTAPVIPTAETSYKVYVEDYKGSLAPETKFGRQIRTGKGERGEETVTVAESAPLGYLQPSETMTEEIVLNRLYDLSRPGKYAVWVQSRADRDGSAKSNRLTITVTDTLNGPAK